MSKELVGVWSWNPREELPPDQINEQGTPDLEAIQLTADGHYHHVQRIPAWVSPNAVKVPEQWWEWKGSWSVSKGELELTTGTGEECWMARHRESGWVVDRNAVRDDRAFKIVELAGHKLQLATKAIGDFDRTYRRASKLPERPVVATPPKVAP